MKSNSRDLRGFSREGCCAIPVAAQGRKLKARLDEAIESLAAVPRPPSCRKLAGTVDRYRIRVGDYRIIYRVDDAKVTVLVLVIGHRREVYDA